MTELYHETQPYEVLHPLLARYFYFQFPRLEETFERLLVDFPYAQKLQGKNVFIQPNDVIIMEVRMNGRKSKGMGGASRSTASQSTSFKWINCPLADTDRDFIQQAEDDLPFLCARLVALVGESYGVSVKYNIERKQFNCSLYKSPVDGNGQSLGLSSFAPNVRLAVLVTLYKFEHICGGVLLDDGEQDASNQFG